MSVLDSIVQNNYELSRVAQGSQTLKSVVTFEVAAADSDGSVYRVIESFPSEAVITNILVGNDAITSGTDYDIGFYDVESGSVVDKDILADGLNLSSAHASGSELSGISAVDVADRAKPVYLLLGKTVANKKPAYDLCFTANTVGSVAGTITAIVEYLI